MLDSKSQTTEDVPRAVLSGRARRLAIALKAFIIDADQFISRVDREDLARASFRLKDFSGDI